ncbi:unnamed protein product [Mytilus edulis]|uniref:DZIP3-like HEPN domain-containing protein n=1 Tax=Mytilus edulis TaxID=6550 RepID=A0A8S3SZN6_MYTED|nr:unnamed protein product [Mytilus edulis]
MATSISAEETYYLRIANLLLKVAPTAVRVKFDKEFCPSGLHTVLNQNKAKIQGLKQKRILNQKQWNLLFPSSVSTDTSEGAALSRIKYYRNEIAHNDGGTLTEQQFHQLWEEVSQAITLLGGQNFTQLCADLKVCYLDGHDKEVLIELRNIRSETIPKGAIVYVDITSEKYALSWKERSLIAEVYLSTNDVNVLKRSKIVMKYDFFPLLCQLYSSKGNSDVETYFTDPIEAINVELEFLMNETDQTTFATLFLFVIYNNCIDENIFNRSAEIRNILLNLSDHFEISSVLSTHVVKLELNKLINSFVKKCENSYSLVHDKIFDILVLFCGNKYFDLCLAVAHTDIIRDRFQFLSLNAEESEGMITVAADKENAYFDRILNDIRGGHIENVFTNIQITFMSYQENLLEHLKNNKDLLNIVLSLSEKESSPLITVVNQGLIYLVHSLIDLGFNVNVRNELGRSPLFIAAGSGYTEIVKLLLNKTANPDICDHKKYPHFTWHVCVTTLKL